MSFSKLSGQVVAEMAGLLRCPVTHAPIHVTHDGYLAVGSASGDRIPVVGGQPVLVDFDNSILDREALLAGNAESLIDNRRRRRSWLKRVMLGNNRVTPVSAGQLVEMLSEADDVPTILIVGGGTISDGAQILYDALKLRILAFDVYASPNTDFVADAHSIPLKNHSVDAVWIEAVLEHVLTPADVVDEIWRVLKPHGLVYAGTPFLQPVHEQAYDFTRFTESGHRWLFRRFECLDSGVVAGPGTVLFQQLRYTIGALVRHRRLGAILAAPFFWLRFLDRFSDPKHARDAASGTYFLGKRSEVPLTPGDMPGQFKGVTK